MNPVMAKRIESFSKSLAIYENLVNELPVEPTYEQIEKLEKVRNTTRNRMRKIEWDRLPESKKKKYEENYNPLIDTRGKINQRYDEIVEREKAIAAYDFTKDFVAKVATDFVFLAFSDDFIDALPDEMRKKASDEYNKAIVRAVKGLWKYSNKTAKKTLKTKRYASWLSIEKIMDYGVFSDKEDLKPPASPKAVKIVGSFGRMIEKLKAQDTIEEKLNFLVNYKIRDSKKPK